jgi:hypothetical protein
MSNLLSVYVLFIYGLSYPLGLKATPSKQYLLQIILSYWELKKSLSFSKS